MDVGRKCGSCEVLAKMDTPLKKCSRCRAISYCSKTCQESHWKAHKKACKKSADHLALLTQIDQTGYKSPSLPAGATFTSLNTSLAKWIKFHTGTLMAATVHALALPHDITRGRTHLVRLIVRPRPDHSTTPSKSFLVVDAVPVEITVAERYGPSYAQCVQELRRIQNEVEGKGKGACAVVCVECSPLPLQFVPFGSLPDYGRLGFKIIPEWKAILIDDVEKGRKQTQLAR